MKKLMIVAACAAASVMLTGCGGSAEGVAEDFAEAVIKKDVGDAVDCMPSKIMTKGEVKKMKERIEKLGKKIDDDKLKTEVYSSKILVPPEEAGYMVVNGVKKTGDSATVVIQFVKDKDLKESGLQIELEKFDGDWKVVSFSEEGGLDTTK